LEKIIEKNNYSSFILRNLIINFDEKTWNDPIMESLIKFFNKLIFIKKDCFSFKKNKKNLDKNMEYLYNDKMFKRIFFDGNDDKKSRKQKLLESEYFNDSLSFFRNLYLHNKKEG